MPPQCAQDARRVGQAQTTGLRFQPARPTEVGSPQSCRHTVDVIEASDVRADRGRHHDCPYADSSGSRLLRGTGRMGETRSGRRSSRRVSGESFIATTATRFAAVGAAPGLTPTSAAIAPAATTSAVATVTSSARKAERRLRRGRTSASGAGRSRRAARSAAATSSAPPAKLRHGRQRPRCASSSADSSSESSPSARSDAQPRARSHR
jgi:hypothetical protein